MKTLLNKRVPVAWLLLTLIASGAIGMLWLVISSGPPSNAVLIQSPPDGSSAQGATEPGGQGQNNERLPIGAAPTQSTTHALPSPQTIAVYVSGAVNNPGVYTLPGDARVGDAIEAAGGPQPDADMERINLAARLTDEQHVSVGKKGELIAIIDAQPTKPAAQSPTRQASVGTTERVNLNKADAKALESLPGIGEVLAARIISDREKNGPFKSVDDLKRVQGIKDSVLSKIRDLVYVEP